MIFAICFLVTHWYLSLFFQSFYLHRYVSHRMFRLSSFYNRLFCLGTILTQGSSFLRPGLYRLLHLRHHQFSDKKEDPHSPQHNKNIFTMMIKTFREYLAQPHVPEDFPLMVGFFDKMIVRISFMALYIYLYIVFTDSRWFLLLVPIHGLMGPIHGAIVNWFGHKSGYRNFEINDSSKNTLVKDFLMMGELYQNNHHAYPQNLKFAFKKGEIDLTYEIVKPFIKL